MSFWGMALGAMAGFWLGGPLGALLGGALGSTFDKRRVLQDSEAASSPDVMRVAFTTALIVLGAKMAKADGRVTPDEVATFKKVFGHLFSSTPEDTEYAARIFNRAKTSADGFEPYAEQIAGMAPRPMLEVLLLGLRAIAEADGRLHASEREYLRKVAGIFGFSAAEFERLTGVGDTARAKRDRGPDPWKQLGLSPEADDAEIKRTYRRLVREHHPDRLIAKGMPKEMIELANQRMAEINRAYDRICEQRGL